MRKNQHRLYTTFIYLFAAASFPVGAGAAPIACSVSQTTAAKDATSKARTMLQKVIKMMDDEDPIMVERIVRWLGVKNSDESHAIKVRLNSAWAWLGGATFQCDLEDPDYAWVLREQPFLIRLGRSFFDAHDSGHSSKAGTLIHETTHFILAGASLDPPKRTLYGVQPALKRAISKPADAQANAENIEYFVESVFDGLSP